MAERKKKTRADIEAEIAARKQAEELVDESDPKVVSQAMVSSKWKTNRGGFSMKATVR